jgi:AraC family transcriptional regulator
VDLSRLEYEKRINRVIDHIRDHLAEDLTLAQLARVAAFSPFHFHRIFRAVTGETLFAFIQRLRLERAALALVHHRDQSVLAVALDSGFSSAATFARAFRARFGMSATAWRGGGVDRRSNQGKANRKPRKAFAARARHRGPVTVKDLPSYHVAYMRHVGPYGAGGIPALWTRLNAWIARHDLDGPDRVTLGIGHDDALVTAPERCRYDACVVVARAFAADRLVNVTDVPGGKYAVSPFTGTAREIVGAWEALYRSWLPDSGYEPDDRPCLEIYRGRPDMTSRPGTFHCELCMPVRPL